MDLWIADVRPMPRNPSWKANRDSFKKYAKVYWPIHYKHVEDTGKDLPRPIADKLSIFLEQGSATSLAYKHWAKDVNAITQYLETDDQLTKRVSEDSFWNAPSEPLGIENDTTDFAHGRGLLLATARPYTYLGVICAFGLQSLLINREIRPVDWEWQIRYGSTQLSLFTLAADRGHSKIIEIFIYWGANVNTQIGNHPASMLNIPCYRSDYPTVETLLRHGADPNVLDKLDSSPLTYAITGIGDRRPIEDIVRLLLDHGADVNTVTSTNGAALHQASHYYNVAIARMLIDHGADIDIRHSLNRLTPLHTAVIKNSSVSYAYEHDKDYEDVHQDVYDYVELLLDAGADINAQTANGDTAVQMAARLYDPPILQLLLAHKADINLCITDYGRQSFILQQASRLGRAESVRILLDNGAEVDAEDELDGFSIQVASQFNHWEVVKVLLENGADVNAAGRKKYTPLIMASSWGKEHIVRLLLKHGADVNARVHTGEAAASGHPKISKLVLDHGTEIYDIRRGYSSALEAASAAFHGLQGASARGHSKIESLQLASEAEVYVVSIGYGSALEAASAVGHRAVAKILLDHGANVNTTGGGYGSPLQAAAAGGYYRLVELLLAQGATPPAARGP